MLPDRSCRLILRSELSGPGENLSSMAQLPKLHTLLRAHRWRLSGGDSRIQLNHTPASDRRSYRSQRAARWPDVADRQCLGQPAVVAFMRLRASLGIEGGFTQAAGAVGSKVGRLLKRPQRRHDVANARRCRRGGWHRGCLRGAICGRLGAHGRQLHRGDAAACRRRSCCWNARRTHFCRPHLSRAPRQIESGPTGASQQVSLLAPHAVCFRSC